MTRRLIALLLACCPLAAAAATAVDVPLDPAVIAKLPSVPVRTVVHEKKLECQGVSLLALLRASGAMPGTPLRGPELARVVVVGARDGYRAAFALAELDPSLGAREVVLTNRCNGSALDAHDGPWRLVVPGDSRPARSVRQVESIRVVDAP
ncbi:molybdopterin-binding oxidoreductase [Lysobacter niastensis]|uniref:Molybdopterin-binding oxidoreductase n=1 Tax=Lysobacter niastensis TaxID=380629 RepID=A0ABS0B3M7_9GAMM|nr:molybdopterin-binding oxidoreductase [Lysobacter niastensis]MBF6022454.1 molybdopterin-binding oxidoreductase [Lysobacter niastensis]